MKQARVPACLTKSFGWLYLDLPHAHVVTPQALHGFPTSQYDDQGPLAAGGGELRGRGGLMNLMYMHKATSLPL